METIKFEVIADFPGSMREVGDIINTYPPMCMSYVVEIDGRSEKYSLKDYPHLFKQIDQTP